MFFKKYWFHIKKLDFILKQCDAKIVKRCTYCFYKSNIIWQALDSTPFFKFLGILIIMDVFGYQFLKIIRYYGLIDFYFWKLFYVIENIEQKNIFSF